MLNREDLRGYTDVYNGSKSIEQIEIYFLVGVFLGCGRKTQSF